MMQACGPAGGSCGDGPAMRPRETFFTKAYKNKLRILDIDFNSFLRIFLTFDPAKHNAIITNSPFIL